MALNTDADNTQGQAKQEVRQQAGRRPAHSTLFCRACRNPYSQQPKATQSERLSVVRCGYRENSNRGKTQTLVQALWSQFEHRFHVCFVRHKPCLAGKRRGCLSGMRCCVQGCRKIVWREIAIALNDPVSGVLSARAWFASMSILPRRASLPLFTVLPSHIAFRKRVQPSRSRP